MKIIKQKSVGDKTVYLIEGFSKMDLGKKNFGVHTTYDGKKHTLNGIPNYSIMSSGYSKTACKKKMKKILARWNACKCSYCQGTGKVDGIGLGHTCTYCKGTGLDKLAQKKQTEKTKLKKAGKEHRCFCCTKIIEIDSQYFRDTSCIIEERSTENGDVTKETWQSRKRCLDCPKHPETCHVCAVEFTGNDEFVFEFDTGKTRCNKCKKPTPEPDVQPFKEPLKDWNSEVKKQGSHKESHISWSLLNGLIFECRLCAKYQDKFQFNMSRSSKEQSTKNETCIECLDRLKKTSEVEDRAKCLTDTIKKLEEIKESKQPTELRDQSLDATVIQAFQDEIDRVKRILDPEPEPLENLEPNVTAIWKEISDKNEDIRSINETVSRCKGCPYFNSNQGLNGGGGVEYNPKCTNWKAKGVSFQQHVRMVNNFLLHPNCPLPKRINK